MTKIIGLSIGMGQLGGRKGNGARNALANEANGVAFDFTDGTLAVKVAGAYTYSGLISGNVNAVITGTLTYGGNGALFNSTNFLNFAAAGWGALNFNTACSMLVILARLTLAPITLWLS